MFSGKFLGKGGRQGWTGVSYVIEWFGLGLVVLSSDISFILFRLSDNTVCICSSSVFMIFVLFIAFLF